MTVAEPQLCLEDVEVGAELPTIEKGPWSNAHIARWCAAQENWERLHYDYKFATQQWALTDVVANGNWRKHAMAQIFKDWAGHGGWLWKLSIQYRGRHYPGDLLTVWARVREMKEVEGLGIVELDCGMKNQDGDETTPGTATVVLPSRRGGEVPNPFVPPASLQREGEYVPAGNIDRPRYVTEEVRGYIGWEGEEVESWDEVCKSELRRFAQAIPDPDPLYWDQDYAKGTRFGTIVGMPLFPVDAFKHPPTEPDRLTAKIKEDPHFWGGPPGDCRGGYPENPAGLPGRLLNAGQSFEVFQLARLGEKLRKKSRLLDIYERQGSTGRLVFGVGQTTYWNGRGEVILKGREVGVHRG
jgi:acyl dehydratase